MGVLGFAPFLQKQFPEVIREIPERFRSLSGKIIAVDGTLITQRLHFAPMSCENRHILGWYRLARELKENGVGVICVFDGEERSHAKQQETERRRKVQRKDVIRGAVEVERSLRLRRLATLLKQYQSLPEPVKDQAVGTLQNIMVAHGKRDAREPFRELGLNTMPDPVPKKEVFTSTFSSLDDQISTSRVPPALLNSVQNQLPTMSSPSKILANQSLAEVRNILPEYHPSRNETRAAEPHIGHPSLAGANDVSSMKDPCVQRSIPQAPLSDDIQLSKAITQKPANGMGQFTQSGVALDPAHGAAGILDKSRDPQFVASRDAPLWSRGEYQHIPDVDDGLTSVATPQNFFQSPVGRLEDKSSVISETVQSDSNSQLMYPEDRNATNVSLSDTPIIDSEPFAESISQGLLSLFKDYQESVNTFLSPPIIDTPAELTVMSEDIPVGAHEQYMMSRNQVQLTLDEGYLWESLVRRPITVSDPVESTWTEEKLELLAQKSDIISKSYEKRNNPPTAKTYSECKLILRAMGVPCIDSVGPYEAEALAASLVHQGFADYVASEDTDVLVYEAPLLRNLTNRQSPLILLSGAEVRQVLQLDRASYVDFALLLGTDFSQRLKNLGPHRAIKLIRTHGRIERLIANEPKFIPRLPPDVYLKQVEVARLVFDTLPPVPNPETLQPTESDDDAVVNILGKFGVYRAAMVDWDFASALDGNYFGDDPAMS